MGSPEVFGEWSAYARKKALYARDVDLGALEKHSFSKIVAVTGIRRCGKSSVLMLLLQKLEGEGKKAAYVNVEDNRLDGTDVLDDALKWFGDEGYLLLDEVTGARDWQGWLARNHELLKGKLKIIVSSSRRNLVVPSKPLRGRILAIELFPLSFKEFLAFKGVRPETTTAGRGKLEKALADYLKYGGFPEVALAEEEVDKVRLLNAYFKDIVGLDVAEVSHEDPGTVEAFGRYVLQSPLFSASKCLNFFKTIGYKIGKEKILRLEKCAEAGYLFFFTPIFSYKLKDKSQYPRKAYAGDAGFFYSTTGKLDLGRIYENIAFLELKRRTQGQNELCYWRNKQGFETDVIVRQGTTVNYAIQVVYSLENEKTLDRELRGLAECAKELKPAKALLITRDKAGAKTVDGVKIRLVPLVDWLQE
ncbi:MAG: ATP-binding protein [Candidatus Micrarchaeota archaeon]